MLEKPLAGEVIVAGQSSRDMSDDRRTALRRSTMGFVYQYHHLLPEFSALENIVLPQMIAGVSRRKAAARAEELLATVGLTQRATHRPARLSGGEQQRVAIARALANAPRLLLADEPTGTLDHPTAEDVFAQLLDLVHAAGVGALIATHTLELAGRMDRILVLEDGSVRPT
jgi:lipoprotein-releasing system ATP-binding protein